MVMKLAALWSLVEHRPIYYSLWTSVKYVSEERPSLFSSSFNYLNCLRLQLRRMFISKAHKIDSIKWHKLTVLF